MLKTCPFSDFSILRASVLLTVHCIGCRAGESCPFKHDELLRPSIHGPQTYEPTTNQSKAQAVHSPAQERLVRKPVPKASLENPREFQLDQVRRRYKPKETQDTDKSAVLALRLVPSDPGFAFEMSALECSLIVPFDYPKARPSIKVRNADIPRGFAINVEHGFEDLAQKGESSLLALMTALDRNLETFLSKEKTETIKLITNADRRHIVDITSRVGAAGSSVASGSSRFTPITVVAQRPSAKPELEFSTEEKLQASERREMETRQLEVRLGRLPLFKKSSDGIAYTLPIEPRRRSELPQALQSVKTVKLLVPALYPLLPCRVQLEGVDTDKSKATEAAFGQKAKESTGTSLLGHINYFAQNMHSMIKNIETQELKPEQSIVPLKNEFPKSVPVPDNTKSHIEIIPRPPEWNIADNSNGSDSSEYTYDSGDESSDAGGIELSPSDTTKDRGPFQNPERGTAVSFPFIELYGIEILEVTTLNISVKCERCRETTEITSLKPNTPKTESCPKCATQLTVTFRPDYIHAHSVRSGFLDLSGATILDMLPSTFIPTCSNCSAAYPLPGIVSVRGETTSNVCRECHQKFTFKIHEVKFLRISTTNLPPATGPRRKKEILGLVAGTELPRRGRCKHYSKSLRWFRFSCCQKVYACDRCHDEAEEHANEHANRMICGLCSREQNYRPDDCAVCHGALVGKRRTGFWEGGKGTRDRMRMSRKDKRKFRRS